MEIHYIYQLEKHRYTVNRKQMSKDFSYAGLEATVKNSGGYLKSHCT